MPKQRNSQFTAEYTQDGRQILNQGVPEGVASTPAPPPPPVIVAPGPVTLFQVTEVKTASLTASWANGVTGDAAESYVPMYRVQGTGTWIEMPALSAAVHAYSFFGLSSNVTYELAIKSINSAGNTISSSITGTTLAVVTATPPGQVIGVAVTGTTSSAATLQYSAPVGGAVVDDYVVEYKQSNSGTWLIFPDGVSSTTQVIINNLNSLTSYDFRITAYNNLGGLGQPSAVATATTGAAATQTPAALTNISVVGTGNPGGISLTVTPATTGQLATQYDYEFKLATNTTWTVANVTSSLTQAMQLTPNALYDFRARPRNAAGAGPYSTVLQALTLTDVMPTAPANFVSNAKTANSISFTWTANAAAQQIAYYLLKYKKQSDASWITAPGTISKDVTTYTLDNLTAATSYQINLTAASPLGAAESATILIGTNSQTTSYPAVNLGIGFNWTDGGDGWSGVSPRTPQASFWTIGNRANVLPWIQSKTWANMIRLPFQWEYLQPVLNGPLDATELGNLVASVTALLNAGKTVLLDCHGFGRYKGFIIDSDQVSIANFADMWQRLGNTTGLKNNPKVFYNLMNEPAVPLTMSLVNWQNAAIAAIRAVGATNPIMASGNFWSGAQNWDLKEPTPNAVWNNKGQQGPGYTDADWVACADFSSNEKMHLVVDPGQNLYWDIHQYFDASNAGGSDTITNLATAAQMNARLQKVTTWARQYGQRLILGEFGGGNVPETKTCIDAVLAHIAANNDVWCGAVWWPASWRMQYAAAATPPIQNLYQEDQQAGFISNQEYWLQGLNPPTGGVVYPTKAQIAMLPASNTLTDATNPSRANVGSFTISDNPWGVDNSDGTGNLPNGWSVQIGANSLSDGSISSRIVWNFPTTTPAKDSGPEITAYPEVWLGDENGTAPQSPDTFFPRTVGSITTCAVTIKYDPTSTTSGEGQLVLDNWYRNASNQTILECMIVVRAHGGYGIPNSPAAAIAGRTGEATGRNMTNYVGSRVTLGGIAFDICRNPAGYMNAWAMYIFIPVTFTETMVFDIKAINNWLVADGIINAGTTMYCLANGDEIRPRMTRPSSGDVLFNTKVVKS